MRTTLAAAVLATVATLVTGCTSDEEGGGDQPSAEASADLRAKADAAAEPTGADASLPALVEAAADWSGSMPGDLAAAVLDALAAHPDALRAAWGPRDAGMPAPDADLDSGALGDALATAGSDADAAAGFRTAYLDYLRSGIARSLVEAAPTVATWPDVLGQVDTVWLDPSAEVIGAVESGCASDDCFDRIGAAMDDAQAAVDAATYEGLPDGLVPASMVRGGERVPMDEWTARMSDDWTRLRESTPLPEIADKIEGTSADALRSSDA